MMTDLWCFTCCHELKRLITGRYVHGNQDDEDTCICVDDGEECQP